MSAWSDLIVDLVLKVLIIGGVGLMVIFGYQACQAIDRDATEHNAARKTCEPFVFQTKFRDNGKVYAVCSSAEGFLIKSVEQ